MNALDPQGPQARTIADISWILFIGGGLIFVGVMLLALLAMRGSARSPKWITGRPFVVGGGIVFPIVVLSALLIYVFSGVQPLFGRAAHDTVRIEIVAEQFWWRVRYLDTQGQTLAITANEIHVPIHRPVELHLRTSDVIHSFWVPQLAGKLDMIPGRTNVLRLQADHAGVYRGQCAEYCGAQHAKMAFLIVAQGASEFEQWLKTQATPSASATQSDTAAGAKLFLAHGCAACHTVQGTQAKGVLGPDLSHVGSRHTLGAGILPNEIGTMTAWIADSQALKPGNRMPSFETLRGEELRALALYVHGLK